MALRPNQNRGPKREEEPYRINNLIKGVTQVRMVGENVEQGIVDFKVALETAQAQGLDLVEISPKAVKTVVKEIRFGPNTDEHDFNFKLKHAINFLKEGSKVKAYVHFVGRAIVFKERGEMLLLNFAKGLEEFGKPDEMPRLEGKRMSIFFSPKEKKK